MKNSVPASKISRKPTRIAVYAISKPVKTLVSLTSKKRNAQSDLIIQFNPAP